MRTPEEVAREYYSECLQVTEPEGSKFAGERFCRSHHVKWVGDLDMCPVQHVLWLTIREHDAAVAAKALREMRDEMSHWEGWDTRDIGHAFLSESVLDALADAADRIERGD